MNYSFRNFHLTDSSLTIAWGRVHLTIDKNVGLNGKHKVHVIGNLFYISMNVEHEFQEIAMIMK